MKRFLFSILCICAINTTIAQDKPNILFFTFEDTSPDFIGCYGNNSIKTPNIDALAKEGIRFTNAYSTNSVCAPSRQTIITGVRTAANGTGNHRSNYKIPDFIKGFPSYLKNAGYYTSNNFKTDYNLAREKAFINQNWNDCSKSADFSNRVAGQPFFAVYNSNTTHQSRTMTESFAYYEKEVLARLTKEELIDEGSMIMPPFYLQSPEMKRNIARMYNCIIALDKELGAMVSRLKAEGLWDNTIIFFYSDHGQGMPNFKTHSSRLGYQVPFIVRVPEKYRKLTKLNNGSTINDLVTFEDLAPSILAICSLPVPTYLYGKNILQKDKITDNIFWGCRDNTDEAIDMARTIIKDSFVYTRNFYPHLPTLQRVEYFDRSDIVKQIRSDYSSKKLDKNQAAILKQPRPAECLYNLRDDQWEINNLSEDPAYTIILKELRLLNEQKMLTIKDAGIIPETMIAQIDRSGDTIMVWTAKNLTSKHFAVAEWIGRGKKFFQRQVLLLQTNSDSLLRYWSAIGIRNQSKEIVSEKNLKALFEKEESDMVKIELAGSMRVFYKDIGAEDYLAGIILNNTNPYLVRQALMEMINSGRMHTSNFIKIRNEKEKLLLRYKGAMSYPLGAALGSLLNENK